MTISLRTILALSLVSSSAALPFPKGVERHHQGRVAALALRGGAICAEDPIAGVFKAAQALSDAVDESPPPVQALVAANVLVWVLWQVLPQQFMYAHFTNSLDNVARGRWWTPLTSAVSHRDLLHLALNMIATLALGPTALNALGHRGAVFLNVRGVRIVVAPLFAAAVLACALASSLAQLAHQLALRRAASAGSGRRRRAGAVSLLDVASRRPGLGFSGVVYGLNVLATLTRPSQRVAIPGTNLVVATAVPVLQRILLVETALLTLVPTSPFGHAAHLGGALGGWALRCAICAPAGVAARCPWRPAGQPGLVGCAAARRALCQRRWPGWQV